MIEDARSHFVDGLRVTPQHLNHLQDNLQRAVQDLRRALGAAAVVYGLRLEVAGTGVTLSKGLAFSPAALALSLATDVPLTLPEGDGSFAVVLEIENGDDPALRVAGQPTLIT